MMSELNQCPCCPATKCKMDEPCLGCETYSQWESRPTFTREELKHIQSMFAEFIDGPEDYLEIRQKVIEKCEEGLKGP